MCALNWQANRPCRGHFSFCICSLSDSALWPAEPSRQLRRWPRRRAEFAPRLTRVNAYNYHHAPLAWAVCPYAASVWWCRGRRVLVAWMYYVAVAVIKMVML